LSGKTPEFDFAELLHPLILVSLALVAGGIGAGFLIYRQVGDVDPIEVAQPSLFRFLANRMWLDELYASTVIALARLASKIADWMDRYVWDGFVRLFAGIGQLLALLTKGFDERGINAGVDEGVSGTRGFGAFIARRHSGQIQAYLGAIAIGMVALIILYAWLG
jgi:NADH-quinone oxidoreductase subunit L